MSDPKDKENPPDAPEVLVEITETFDKRVTRISGKGEAVANVLRARSEVETTNGSTQSQSISGSSAGGDIVQITHIHYHIAGDANQETRMADERGKPNPAGGQSMKDVKAGGAISQTSDNAADQQRIQRAETPGAVTQKKGGASRLSLGKYGGTGWGVLGLVIVVIAYFAYKYLSR
jgi:hypothetical protein